MILNYICISIFIQILSEIDLFDFHFFHHDLHIFALHMYLNFNLMRMIKTKNCVVV